MPSARTNEPNWTKIWTEPPAAMAMSAVAVATSSSAHWSSYAVRSCRRSSSALLKRRWGLLARMVTVGVLT